MFKDPTQSYAYYYDVYRTLDEAQNPGDETELTRNEGYFTPSNGTPTEWQWVIGDVHHDAVTIHRHQGYNAFGEVSRETDGRGNTVELYYNTLGHLTLKRDPLVAITYANGYQAWMQPETRYSYDRSGRLVGQIDANGNVTTQIWNDGTGTVAQEFRADGGTTVYQYDVFGNLRIKTEALDVYSLSAASARRTDYSYDAGNRLIRIERPAVNGQRAVDTYTYDELDRRLSHTNNVTGTDTVDYDLEGNVRQIVSGAGRVTTYTTVWDSTLHGGQGGWVQTTTLPYNPGDTIYGQSVLIDVSTVFGQVTQHTDIAGRVTDYLYYHNGLLKQQGATTYSYYNNGLLHEMLDAENGTRGYYEYDNNGNLTFEGFTGKSGGWAFQQSLATYDALNRLVSVSDPRYNLTYEYDAVGNRIHLRSEYNDAFGQPNQVQDYWYAYDAMNRFTTTMGQLKDGVRGSSATDTGSYVWRGTSGDGVDIAYNAYGERMIATYASDGHSERYAYDAQGYLTTTTLYDAAGQRQATATRTNDLAGRVLEYVETNATGFVTQRVQHTWDKDSLLIQDKVTAWDINAKDDNGNLAPRYTITTTTTNRLADGTVSSTYTDYDSKNDGSSPHTYITTTYEYVWFDSAKQSRIRVQASNQEAPGWAPGLSSFEYDSFGRIKAAYDVDGGRGFAYQTDGEGRILHRDELLGTYNEATGKIDNATANRRHSYYYLDDRQIGNVGNDGVERIDYAQELAQRAQNNSNKDSQHKRFQPVAGADFDGNYAPINSLYPTAAPGSYIVHAGDTLTSIAMALWGDSSLWWLLADANGLSLNEPLIPNTVLTVPNKVTNIHNNSSTFKPYDAGKAIGNTNPTIPDAPPPPPPPGKKGCGGLLQVVAIAVAVVATIYTAGAASAALGGVLGATGGTIAGGVIGGAVGSIASQGVLMAGGAQNGFDWKGVAMGAVAGGVSAGVGQLSVGSRVMNNSFVSGAIDGAVSTAATNIVGSVAGIQSFNWKNVAAGAVSSGVSRGVSQNLPGAAMTSKPTWGNQLASQVAGGMGSAAVYGNLSQQALMGTTMNAIASTIGNSIAGQMASKSAASTTGSGNPYADVKRYADAVEASGALGSSNLPPINMDPRSVVEPFTFDAQPLIGPNTLASIGPVLRSDVVVNSLPASGSAGGSNVRTLPEVVVTPSSNGNVTTLSPIMVTPNDQFNEDYANLWQWSVLNHRQAPPVTTSQTVLDTYRNEQLRNNSQEWHDYGVRRSEMTPTTFTMKEFDPKADTLIVSGEEEAGRMLRGILGAGADGATSLNPEPFTGQAVYSTHPFANRDGISTSTRGMDVVGRILIAEPDQFKSIVGAYGMYLHQQNGGYSADSLGTARDAYLPDGFSTRVRAERTYSAVQGVLDLTSFATEVRNNYKDFSDIGQIMVYKDASTNKQYYEVIRNRYVAGDGFSQARVIKNDTYYQAIMRGFHDAK